MSAFTHHPSRKDWPVDDLQEKKRAASLEKDRRNNEHAHRFMAAREKIPTGTTRAGEIAENKARIMEVLGGTEEDWADWHWQLRHRIDTVEVLAQVLDLSKQELQNIDKVGEQFRWGFSPHYASLMSRDDAGCPVRLQMVPEIDELAMTGIPDFSGEEYTSPAPASVRWYPDRSIIYSTNICSAFCRHCLRRRHIGEVDQPSPEGDLEAAFAYLRKNEEIRDVLITGGDPLTYSDDKLDWMLTELDKIPHIEIKRLGSKMPITVPQRITPELCEMLSRHHPLYINVQVNHPREITADTARACDLLTRAGIPLGNQSVLLRRINDDPDVIKVLNHELLKIRVKPYYLYHCQGTIGIAHFRTPVERGIEIVENLRGFTSGMAVPSFIITPAGLGKTPLAPQYQISSGDGFVTLRNWEGTVYKYDNPPPVPRNEKNS